jgi:hypothetical protein
LAFGPFLGGKNMKKIAITTIGAAALAFSGAASAQSFTFDVVWEPVESVGGISGPNNSTRYGGGSVIGTYTTTFADGTTSEGSARCVGMRQPHGSIFAIHLACTTTEAEGSASLIYGCNFLGEPGPETPLGCVGTIEGKDGPFAGRWGALTMEWYSATGSRGTGQWYLGE